MAQIRNYLVISPLPVVVDDAGTAISYSPGQIFQAPDNNASVVQLLADDKIVISTGTITGGFTVVVGPAGPTGPAGLGGTLASTLLLGNTSDGTDIVMTDGSGIVMGSGAGPSNIIWNGSGNIGSATIADRPDNVYVQTSVVVGSTITVSTNTVIGSSTLGISSTGRLGINSVSDVWIGSASSMPIQIGLGHLYPQAVWEANPSALIVIEPGNATSAGTWVGLFGATAGTAAAGDVYIEGGYGNALQNAGSAYINGGWADGGPLAGGLVARGGDGGSTAAGGPATVSGGTSTHATLNAGDARIRGGSHTNPARRGRVLVGDLDTRSIAIGTSGVQAVELLADYVQVNSNGDILLEVVSGAGPGVGIYLQGAAANALVAGGFINIEGGFGRTSLAPGGTYIYGGHAGAVSGGDVNGYTGVCGILQAHGGYGYGTGSGGLLDLAGGLTNNATKFGGDAWLRGGQNTAASANNGRVFIGDANTRSIQIGAVGITTTVLGTLAGVTLATTLAAGNTTGTNNISVNTGQKLIGAAELTLEATGANAVLLRTNSAERARVTALGSIYIGDGTADNSVYAAAGSAQTGLVVYKNAILDMRLQVYGTGATDYPNLYLSRGRGTAAVTAVPQNGDVLGQINFQGGSTATVSQGGFVIRTTAEGTFSATNSPARTVFLVGQTGSGTPLERVRFTTLGTVWVGDGTIDPAVYPTTGDSTACIFSYKSGSMRQVMQTYSNTATDAPQFMLERGRGTPAVPAVPQSGDTLGNYMVFGGATSTVHQLAFGISTVAEATFTGSNCAARAVFFVGTASAGTAVERARFVPLGTLLFGDGTLNTTIGGNGVSNTPWSAYRNEAVLMESRAFSATATDGSFLNLRRYRGTAASSTITADGDVIGAVRFHPANAANSTNQAAQIICENDGTPSGTSTPVRIRIDTTPSGSLVALERLRITNGGNVYVGVNRVTLTSPTHLFSVGDNATTVVSNLAAGTGAVPHFSMWAARGTLAAPTATQSTDLIGVLEFAGRGTSAYLQGAVVEAVAEAAFTTVPSARLVFRTSAGISPTEKMRVDGSGTVFIGDGTAGAWAAGPIPIYTLLTYRNGRNLVSPYAFSATATDQPEIIFARGRGTAASPTATTSGDSIGQISFNGFSSATTGTAGAVVSAEVDGAVATNILPGRLIFKTTPSGTGTPVERGRFNNLGTLFLGNGVTTTNFGGAGNANNPLLAHRDSTNNIIIDAYSSAAATDGSFLIVRRSRGSAASPAVVTSGDTIGALSFQAATTSTDTREFAGIYAEVDGSVALNDAPGRLRFLTTLDGASTPTERMRIDNNGKIFLGPQAGGPVTTEKVLIINNTAGGAALRARADATSGTSIMGQKSRGTTAAPTIVQQNDTAAYFAAQAYGTSDWWDVAGITMAIDGSTISNTSMPGRIAFSTTPSGSVVPVERMRISHYGTVGIGDGTISASFGPAAERPFQIYSSSNTASIENSIMQFNSTGTMSPALNLVHGRGTAASPTSTQSGDVLGYIFFCGSATGSPFFTQGGVIASTATATHSAGSFGGDLIFMTSANGAGSVTSRWRITDDGHFITNALFDNSYDIGASGASRPRRVYVGTEVVVGSTVTISTSAITGSTSLGLASTGANNVTVSTGGVVRATFREDTGGAQVVVGNGLSSATPIIGYISSTLGSGAGVAGADLQIDASGAADGNGGNLFLYSANGTGTNRNGGKIRIESGAGTGSGASGNIEVVPASGAAVVVGTTTSFRPTTYNLTFNSTNYDVDGLLYKDVSSGNDIIAIGLEQGGGAPHLSFAEGGCLDWYDNVSIATGDVGISFSNTGTTLFLDGGQFEFATNDYNTAGGLTKRLRITSGGNVVVGAAALATTATDGFFYIPSCAGAPTGVPTTYTGMVPMVYDSTNDEFYIYSGGAWKSVLLA